MELSTIIAEEKLKPAETRKFVEYSFRDGVMKTTGTDVDKILPPMSRFGGGMEKKKLTVIERLKAFFERFIKSKQTVPGYLKLKRYGNYMQSVTLILILKKRR